MATKKGSTAVAKQAATSGGSVVPVNEELLNKLAANAGAGRGNATAQDYALPFLYLLQKMSPAVDDVEGAEPGMFINTVTNELYDELVVVPVEFDKVYNEWVPRDDGGGFVASHRTRADADKNKREDSVEKKGKDTIIHSTQIVDTANHYLLVRNADGSFTPAILSLTSKKLKSSRKWMSMIQQVVVEVPGAGKVAMPSWAKMYRIVAIADENDKGKFFVTDVLPIEGEAGWVQDIGLINQAEDFRASLQAGQKGAVFTEAVDEAAVEDVEDDEEKASGKKKF